MIEEWKEIEIRGRIFLVSTLGRIKRIAFVTTRIQGETVVRQPQKEKFIVGPKLSSKGYPRVNLAGSVVFVHRVIAQTFLPVPPPDKNQINHKNGIKTDNRVENLEWVTNQENRDHAVASGLVARGEQCSKKFTENEIREIRRRYEAGEDQYHLATVFNAAQQTISKIVRRDTWKHLA